MLAFKVFEQYAQALHDRFPGLLIEGDNFPPPPTKAFIAQALNVAKLVLIGLIVSGMDPFAFFNVATPSVYTWAKENKLYACLMLFFISNALEGQMISTGAFEISYNDVPIWSKLESGRLPSPQEMFQMVENMQMGASRPARSSPSPS
ncbi:hypothetical protein ACOMHN_018299 [Nucella lapillus]